MQREALAEQNCCTYVLESEEEESNVKSGALAHPGAQTVQPQGLKGQQSARAWRQVRGLVAGA